VSPFKSKAQRAYLHIHEPAVANRWEKAYSTPKNLPQHVKQTKLSSVVGATKSRSKKR
jgi:hypothetical protein